MGFDCNFDVPVCQFVTVWFNTQSRLICAIALHYCDVVVLVATRNCSHSADDFAIFNHCFAAFNDAGIQRAVDQCMLLDGDIGDNL